MERNKVLDALKGLCVVLVLVGHAIIKIVPEFWTNLLFNIIYSFHMSVFFGVAGFLAYYVKDMKRWLKKRALLLIPHFIITLSVYYLSSTNITEWGDLTKTHSFYDWFIQSVIYNQGEWFLFTLVTVSFLAMFIMRVKGLLWAKGLVLLGIVLLPAEMFMNYEVLYYLPIFIAGYMVAKRVKLQGISNHYLIPLVVLYIIIMYFSGWNGGWGSTLVVMFLTNTKWGILRYLQAGTAIPIVYILIRALGSGIPVLFSAFAWLGQRALPMYLCNLLFAGLYIGQGWIAILASTIFSLAIGVFVSLIIDNIKPYIYHTNYVL